MNLYMSHLIIHYYLYANLLIKQQIINQNINFKNLKIKFSI